MRTIVVFAALALLATHASAAATECDTCDCDNCKCRKSEAGKGCMTAGKANHCPTAKEDDPALCKDPISTVNTSSVANFECKYPTVVTAVTSDKATTLGTNGTLPFTLRPNQWTFFSVEVPFATAMHNVDYELQIPQAAANITAAFLVGRCLKEVECGDCPPRCDLLQSVERRPQFCTLAEYCPGCSEDDGCRPYANLANGNKEYHGRWANLKSCEKEKANFYIGVFGMPMAGVSTFDQDSDTPVSAELKVWWNAEKSAGFVQLPSLLLIVALVVSQFVM